MPALPVLPPDCVCASIERPPIQKSVNVKSNSFFISYFSSRKLLFSPPVFEQAEAAGFLGNHPHSTLFFCLNNSTILQKQLKAIIPRAPLKTVFSINSDMAHKIIPAKRKTGHSFVPKWYSP
jgi:hypothetical protein